jgi:hypothetical protein
MPVKNLGTGSLKITFGAAIRYSSGMLHPYLSTQHILIIVWHKKWYLNLCLDTIEHIISYQIGLQQPCIKLRSAIESTK